MVDAVSPPRSWSGDEFGRGLIVQNFLAIPSPIIRREAWLAAGGMDTALWYTADWDLYLKLARRETVAVRPQTTTAFRIHGGSLTMTGSRTASALREQHEIVLKRHGDAFGLGRDHRLHARAPGLRTRSTAASPAPLLANPARCGPPCAAFSRSARRTPGATSADPALPTACCRAARASSGAL